MEAEQAIQPPTRRGRRLFWGFLALIVALPIIALLIWYLVAAFGRGPYYNMDSQEVFASHLLVLQEKDHLLNVESNDPAVVQSWFRSRLDFVPPACDLAAAGFALAGGRLDFMHDRAVAALVYRHDEHVIEIYAWPGQTQEHPFARSGLYLIPWNKGNLMFWAISNLNEDELGRFVQAFQAATGNP